MIGVGFGPSNLSLAILLEEMNAGRPDEELVTAHFFESQEQFGWHSGMLLPDTDMQISFLKDLATPRNPRSAYSFINYIFEQGRLPDFTNLKTFNPSRREFHAYLRWAAEKVGADVDYRSSVSAVGDHGGSYEVLVHDADGSSRAWYARNVILGTGITPTLPDGITPSPRIFHNHRLLSNLENVPSFDRGSFVVVGSGQSAAEVTQYLHSTFPGAEVHSVYRRFGYTPSDDTPFANQIFDAVAVDEFYYAPPEVKQELLRKHWLTNYSAVDADLIGDLYRRWYDERVAGGRHRLHYHRVSHVAEAVDRGDHVHVSIENEGGGGVREIEADAVVYATGFTPGDPRALFDKSVNTDGAFDEAERPVINRNYRLELPGQRTGGIYLNGNVEHSHGLTSSLLSNVSIRSQDILSDLLDSARTAAAGAN
nr:SidA/IucD/PvdA family monooxygenase [Corynebacterium neomassiliense]